MAVMVITTLTGLGALIVHTVNEGSEIRERSEKQIAGMTHVMAEQTSRSLQTIDLTLRAVADAIQRDQIDWHYDSLHLHAYLRDRQKQSVWMRNLFLIDENGQLQHESESFPATDLDLSDRAYFTLQKYEPSTGLFISRPILSRITHDWIVVISRRLEKTNGDFDGVIAASVDLSRLHAFLDLADLGEGSEIALYLANGSLLTRLPRSDAPADAPFLGIQTMARAETPNPIFLDDSTIDGVRRIYAIYRVPDVPLYILAGVSESAVMRDWNHEWTLLLGVSFVVVTIVAVLAVLTIRNSTRRDRMFEALTSSQQRFRDFAEAASDRFWESDAQHRLTWHSGLNGQKRDYIGKTRWGNLGIDPDQDPLWGKLKEDMDAHRTFRDFRYSRVKEDGSVRHRIVSGKPMYDETGVFLGYRGIYSDVTPQVTTQERAQRSRDRFLRSIENLAEGFALYDADDRLIVCNTRFQEIYAPITNSLVRWSSFEDFLRECIEHGLIPEAVGREEAWIAERLAQHRDAPQMREVLRKGRWLQIRERKDKEGGTMLLALDIHEHKIAELERQSLAARLRTIFDNMPAGCFLLDNDRRILDWNRGAEEIFGYDKAEALGKDSFDLIVAPEQRADNEAHVKDAFRGKEIDTHVSVNRAKDGRVLECEWVNARLTNDNGDCVGLISMVRDVSEKRAAEERLQQKTRMEAIGQLTGGIAHDFNNLLQVIIGNSELLLESLADAPRERRMAAMTKKAAEHGADLTLRLLAYSRRQTLEPVEFDMSEAIGELRHMLSRAAGDAVTIKMSLADSLWTSAVDRGQFDQALLNLVLNARDAMPQGGDIEIATANVELGPAETAGDAKPGDYVLISVTDNGAGMTPDTLKRAFEPFFTTKGLSKGASKGNGLGLSMVHGFVNQSGGLVRLASEVGKGTTVRIYFPRAAEKKSGKPETGNGERNLSRKTILVVEDNDMVRNYVTAQLEMLGYEVIEAENGPAGLLKLENAGHIDLLFTDVIMPGGMNGRELAERALERWPDLKVLFTSGYDESAISTEGRLTHGMFLLKKPYQRQDMEAKIREVLASDSIAAA